MKSKFLLTALLSIGIIGMASAQGFSKNDRIGSKNDRIGGPHKTVIVTRHESPRKVVVSPRKTVIVKHVVSRPRKTQIHRIEKRHQRVVVVKHYNKRHF